MITGILFVLMLLVLVIPHELGHMIVAKLLGVQVNEFSVGMGPLIFQKQKGETMYSIRLLPLGGYCQMEGEDELNNNPRAFNNKKPSEKMAVLLAGPCMNVILAIVIVFGILSASGVPTTVLDEVQKPSPAYEAGMRTGDKVIAIDGERTTTWSDVTAPIDDCHEGEKLEIEISRKGKNHTYYVTPAYNEESKRFVVGIISKASKNPIYVLPQSIRTTKDANGQLIRAFKQLFTGKMDKVEVSGPVGIVKTVDQSRSYGMRSYLLLVAMISLNLALFNLLPFPSLDGGRVVFVIIRMITGKAISDETEGMIHAIGMLLLLGLFVLVTINDVINLF